MPAVPERMIVRRIERIMERKPTRLNLTFVEDNKITAEEVISKLPMFQARGITAEDIATAIANAENTRLSIADGVITLAPEA